MGSDELVYKLENPNDLNEQARLDIQHQTWLLTFDGSLRATAIPTDFKPKSVLDLGCGSGTWAAAYAQQHPDCTVTAFDINPSQNRNWPKNLDMITQSIDAEKEDQWPQGTKFDYVHLRMLTLALRDYAAIFRICWKHLSPGGWIEIDDARIPYEAENAAANLENSMFLRCSYLQIQAQANNGIDVMASRHHTDRLKLLGFDNVSQTSLKWPVNGDWPEDDRLKQIGKLTGSNWQRMWSMYGPTILSNKLSMSKAQATEICDKVLQECRDDRDMHYYFPMDITTAQRPFLSE